MKVNQQYLKDLLIAFEDREGPETMINELASAGYDINDSNFIFHMRLLDDNGLIVRIDGQPGFGYEYRQFINGQDYSWHEVPLRLTARGHDFIADLRQKEVWQTIKTNFKEEGISTLMELSKSLAMGFAKKKIKALTDLDIE